MSRDIALGLSAAWLLTAIVSVGALMLLAGWVGVGDVFVGWSALSLPLFVITLRVTGTRMTSAAPGTLLIIWGFLLGAALSGVDHRAFLSTWLIFAWYAGFPIATIVSATGWLFRKSGRAARGHTSAANRAQQNAIS